MNLHLASLATALALGIGFQQPPVKIKTGGFKDASKRKIVVTNLRLPYELRIVLERAYLESDAHRRLFTMLPNGSGLTELPRAGSFSDRREPAPHPGKAVLAFSGQVSNNPREIYTMNFDGSSLRALTTGGPNVQAAWSPNGQQIAYAHLETNAKGQAGIYVMNADGSNPRRIATSIRGQFPTWTPNGTSILYCEISGGKTIVYRQSVAGPYAPAMLAVDAEPSKVALSPDGTRMAYRCAGGYIGVRTINGPNPSFGLPTLLTIHGIGMGFCIDKNPSWSPDGKQILCERSWIKTNEMAAHSSIILMDAFQGERIQAKSLIRDPLPQVLGLDFNTCPNWVKLGTLGAIETRPTVAAPPPKA